MIARIAADPAVSPPRTTSAAVMRPTPVASSRRTAGMTVAARTAPRSTGRLMIGNSPARAMGMAMSANATSNRTLHAAHRASHSGTIPIDPVSWWPSPMTCTRATPMPTRMITAGTAMNRPKSPIPTAATGIATRPIAGPTERRRGRSPPAGWRR